MSSVDLVFNLIGKDKTSAAFKSAGDSMGRLGKTADDAGRKVTKSGDDADRAGARMRGAFKGVDGALGNVATMAARAGAALGAIAIGGIAVGVVKATQAASDLGESINAVNVTFGDAADGIQQLGRESAKSLGLSRSEFNSLAVQFSNFAQTIAGPGGDVAASLDELTTRASDFASVMNLDVSEAATLFQSGLAGETEPLRKYGLDLSAAAVEAYAMANGIGDGTGELTEQEKVLSRYGILMASTSKTAGDFANTQGSMANQSKLLRSNLENFAATVGTAFTPLAEAVMPAMNDVLVDMTATLEQNMPAISEQMREFGTQAGEAVATVVERWPLIQTAISDVAGKVRENWPEIKQAAEDLGAALQRVGDLAAAAWDAWKGLPPEAQQTIATLAVLDKTGVVDVKMVITPLLSGAAGALGATLGALFTGAAAAISIPVTVGIVAYVATVSWVWNQDWYADARRMVETTMGIVFEDGVMSGIAQVPGIVASGMAANATLIAEGLAHPFVYAWENISGATAVAWQEISRGIRNRLFEVGVAVGGWALSIQSTVANAWNTITSTVSAALATVGASVAIGWGNVANWTSQTWASITSAISGAWNGITSTVSAAVAVVGTVVASGWNNVTTTISGAMDQARAKVAGALDGIRSLFAGAVDSIGATWSRITGVVAAPIAEMFGFINRNMIGPINTVLGVFDKSLYIDPLGVPTYHQGGYTSAVGGPEGLALLRNDEFVSDPAATARNRAALEAGNAGAKLAVLDEALAANRQGFGIGGPFDGITDLVAEVKSWAMAGAGNAMGKVADPALSWLRDTYGGSWSPDVVIAGMGKAVDAAKAWATGEDSKRAAASSMSSVAGSFIGPSSGILGRPLASYAVTSEFGPRWGTMHAGIDLGAPGGTPIYAAAAGLVQQAGWNDGYGNYLRMDHGGGLGTSYGHMSAIIARAGQTLAAGQLLGLVGTTGDSTGDHLHFETYQNGAAVNPRQFVGFDSGGWLQPGATPAVNKTGKPEAVLTAEQWAAIRSGATDRTVVEVHIDGRVLHESLIRYRREVGVA